MLTLQIEILMFTDIIATFVQRNIGFHQNNGQDKDKKRFQFLDKKGKRTIKEEFSTFTNKIFD